FAAAFLRMNGLERFYDLRGDVGVPAASASERVDESDLAAFRESIAQSGRLTVDVQGMHCAGCVWLIESLFKQRANVGRIDLDPASGSATLYVEHDFPIDAFAADLSSVGYRIAEPGEKRLQKNDDLLWRVALAFVLAGNAMFFAIAVYIGLEEGPLKNFLDRLSLGAGVLAAWIAAPIFLRSSWNALRRGIVSMDLPIALGIVLSTGAALVRFVRDAQVEYVDTLAVFIALVLLGRWLQERTIERNRNRLVGDKAAGRLRTRRKDSDATRTIRCRDVRKGDELVFGTGELVPVDVTTFDKALFSLDWINGESEPAAFEAGASVPAGAFYQGRGLVRATAESDFADSRVPHLLARTRDDDQSSGWWAKIGTVYTMLVLSAAALGATLWWGDGDVALRVTTAVLIVTCPCAIGIAIPLARAFAHRALREHGFFIRTRSLLERLHGVERIVFDKTGTLTTGDLKARWELREGQRYVGGEDLRVLRRLASVSQHPKSRAIADLVGTMAPFEDAEEVIGRGVEVIVQDRRYRLGSRRWCANDGHAGGDVAFSCDGRVLASFRLDERLRDDAAAELAKLGEHYALVIASGDGQARVDRLARPLGLTRAFGDLEPEAKAALVRDGNPERTLMVGDGLNDHLALLEAGCAGTPATGRPFVASRCDFYITSGGLSPLRRAFEVARWMRRTQRALLAFALVYNLGAVALALSSAMAAWMAAVLMPLSSLFTLALVALGARRLRVRPEPEAALLSSSPSLVRSLP
ncbi:MAG: heavy metal translocating P-type ATPase, partial [Myxococcota bacterium]